jgi:hypothetical protein
VFLNHNAAAVGGRLFNVCPAKWLHFSHVEMLDAFIRDLGFRPIPRPAARPAKNARATLP